MPPSPPTRRPTRPVRPLPGIPEPVRPIRPPRPGVPYRPQRGRQWPDRWRSAVPTTRARPLPLSRPDALRVPPIVRQADEMLVDVDAMKALRTRVITADLWALWVAWTCNIIRDRVIPEVELQSAQGFPDFSRIERAFIAALARVADEFRVGARRQMLPEYPDGRRWRVRPTQTRIGRQQPAQPIPAGPVV